MGERERQQWRRRLLVSLCMVAAGLAVPAAQDHPGAGVVTAETISEGERMSLHTPFPAAPAAAPLPPPVPGAAQARRPHPLPQGDSNRLLIKSWRVR